MDPEASDANWKDLTLSIDQLVGIVGRWFPIITILSLLPYVLIHGLPPLPDWSGLADAALSVLFWSAIGLAVYAASAIVHEGLHVLAMLTVARVPISSLRFGARLSEGVLYVHSDRPMSVASYRIVLMLPAILLGILPAAVGTIEGIGWLVLYGYVMILSAVGDFAVLQLIRDLDAAATVRDHHQKVGCQVLVEEDRRVRRQG